MSGRGEPHRVRDGGGHPRLHVPRASQRRGRWMLAQTSTRWAACCTNCSPGEPPISAVPAPQAILAKRVFECRAAGARRCVRRVPEPLEQAVTKALAPMAADRYATAGDFCRALATAPIFTSGPTLGPSKGPTAETPTKSARQVFRAAADSGARPADRRGCAVRLATQPVPVPTPPDPSA